MNTNKINYQILVDSRNLLNGGIVLANELFNKLNDNGNIECYAEKTYIDSVEELEDLIGDISESNPEYNDLIEYLENYAISFNDDPIDLKEEYFFNENLDGINEYLQDNGYLNDNEYFQYYVISERNAELLQELTDETIFYSYEYDVYFWAVGHYGTGWDCVPLKLKKSLWIEPELLDTPGYKTCWGVSENTDK